ncbi:MAG: hypothetical protein QNK37_07515 [Acidobacteriota bacterium]|nr:hypothetical protein [Acidobacteriota bacterium]
MRAILFFCVFCGLARAGEVVPFSSERWQISARESRIERHLDRESLYLKGGIAYLGDSAFKDGTIEFDLSLPGERGFMGAVWRLVDGRNYEEFYVRPHQSGKPDANQYTPVFNGLSGWQLYHGPGYGVPVTYAFNTWFHVKIVVSGQQAEVYIEDMEKPVLFVPELKREPVTGKVGVKCGNFSPAWFSNFRFEASTAPRLKGSPPKIPVAGKGTLKKFKVSDSFAAADLAEGRPLDAKMSATRKWRDLAVETSGVANLARLQGVDRQRDTAFVRLVINAAEAGLRKIDFGYSDRVRVYVAGKPVYQGNNRYLSRDFRYLGTIGYFDSLYLDLKQGRNEVLFAVSEAFGGWGFQARIENQQGLTIE